jgi:two-component system, NtrC family, nitrogen regulation response regulator NtrX
MAHDILIVDDEADIRMLIAGVLKDEGYATRDAADSGEALLAIQARQPTLVVLDIWLQGSELDGIGILRQLQAEMPSVPVVMISGHGTIETAVEAARSGRGLARDQSAAPADRAGRADREPSADHRGAGLRQGSGRPPLA